MKKTLFLLTVLTLISCKKEQKTTIANSDATTVQELEELGKSIFEGQANCFACHQENQISIGPSIKEIAKTYKAKNRNIITFLKGKGNPIVDPSQFEVMKINLYVTQALSEEELKALEAYFYSFLE